MSTETVLLPCPHCGDSEWLELGNIYNNPAYKFTVSCKTCGAESCDKETAEEAAAAWNRRAPQTVAVIALPIEWEQRGSEDFESREYFVFESKARDDDGNPTNEFVAFHRQSHIAIDHSTSIEEAKAACQTHKQLQVDITIGGCNVRPWIDSQGLVDSIKEQFADFETAKSEGPDALSALTVLAGAIKHTLKAWEEQNLTKIK